MQNFPTWYKTYEDNNSLLPTLIRIRINYVIKMLSIEYNIYLSLDTLNLYAKVIYISYLKFTKYAIKSSVIKWMSEQTLWYF